jgi:UDP-N-acetylmuramoyl-tripeptide--D-alanyl-D-alanine ligase
VAVVTAVDYVHAEFFDSLESIAEAKFKIFDRPETQLGIYNGYVPYYVMRGTCRKVPCIELPDKWVLPAHYKINFALAAEVAKYFDLSEEEITRGKSLLRLPDKRFQVIEKQGIIFVDDSYNACRASMEAALKNLPLTKGKTIAVLGEMAELGRFSEEAHRIVGKNALKFVDKVFFLGKSWDFMDEYFERKADLLAELKKTVEPGDVVLLKGSNNNKLWEILDVFL